MNFNRIPVLNHGIVQLVDVMGGDLRPAQIARKSFRNNKPKSEEEEQRLVRYLVKHQHTTPIEFCEVVFFLKMPIFVARQLVRHRTASIEEVSLRYVEAVEEFYVPELDRCQRQSKTNKQGSSVELIDDPEVSRTTIEDAGHYAFRAYERLINQGLAKELARTVLPLGTYTEWYWKCDLHNTLHMLGLRLDSHAQYEIRVYAEAMLAQLRPIFPTIIETWADERGIELQ